MRGSLPTQSAFGHVARDVNMAGAAQRRLVIFGDGGHAVSVADLAASAGFAVVNFVGTARVGGQLLGARVVGDVGDVIDLHTAEFAIALGDNAAREALSRDVRSRFDEHRFPCLIHPTANVSRFATLGFGTVVMAQANVGANCHVGRFCLLNTASSIDHDGRMEDFSSLAPRAVTGGGVSIGRRTAVSIGATVKHRVRIGADSVIGAMSFVNKDVGDRQVVYGVPARLIRAREVGDAYLE